MAGKINHRFDSPVPDEGVAEEVGPNEWDDSLVVSEGADGQLFVRRTAQTDGWELIYIGAPLTFINATQVPNSGTSLTDLHSFTFPVDHFNANKRSVRYTLKGSFAANANVKTLNFVWGAGAAIVLNPVTGSPNGVRFEVEIVVTRTGVDAQNIYIKSLVGLAAYDLVSKTSRTEDDGAAIIGKITGQSGTASDDILLDQTTVENLN
jgi:hypothetical protein